MNRSNIASLALLAITAAGAPFVPSRPDDPHVHADAVPAVAPVVVELREETPIIAEARPAPLPRPVDIAKVPDVFLPAAPDAAPKPRPKVNVEFEAAPYEAETGGKATVVLRAHNGGPIAAENLVIQIDLPEQFRHERFGRQTDYRIGRLEPGGTRTARLVVDAVESGRGTVFARPMGFGDPFETLVSVVDRPVATYSAPVVTETWSDPVVTNYGPPTVTYGAPITTAAFSRPQSIIPPTATYSRAVGIGPFGLLGNSRSTWTATGQPAASFRPAAIGPFGMPYSSCRGGVCR